MIDKLLEAVIKKHGPVDITSINTGSGVFMITTFDDLKLVDIEFSKALQTSCFDIETGLINHLSKDRQEGEK